MSRLAIKICGLSTPETVGAAVRAGASHLGFVHFPKSPRHVEADHMRALAASVPAHVGRVAVVVDADDAELARIVGTEAISALQLHGKESPERVAAVKERFGLKVMKAISVSTTDDIENAKSNYDGVADFLLFDAKPPKDSVLPGGNAVSTCSVRFPAKNSFSFLSSTLKNLGNGVLGRATPSRTLFRKQRRQSSHRNVKSDGANL